VASVHIITRETGSGRRFIVRFRTGGRESALRHGGSFRTRRDAEHRARFIGGELAAGRLPDLNITVPVRRTFAEVAERWRASRLDHAEQTPRTPARTCGASCRPSVPVTRLTSPAPTFRSGSPRRTT
jgi:hypothetical protein